MRIFFQGVVLRVQKQAAPTISQTKVQTFLNSQEVDHRYLFINKFGDHYPEKTDRHCWWCRHPFDSKPMGIPVEIYTDENQVSHVVMEGIVCSFECCFSFLSDYCQGSSLFSYRKSKSNLLFLYNKMGHKGELCHAPDWKLLEKVGTGNMTISQFRSGLAIFHRIPTIIPYNHVTRYMICKKTA